MNRGRNKISGLFSTEEVNVILHVSPHYVVGKSKKTEMLFMLVSHISKI